MRKETLAIGETYHIFSKSIAEFVIFNNKKEYLRMKQSIKYYQREKPDIKFSKFTKNECAMKDFPSDKEKLASIIAYCLMPTHFHLVLKQLKQDGISIFMAKLLNSYSRYFNIRHNRKGPLWETEFKNVLVKTDEQLLHLTRYIHLNPVTTYLVDKAEDWSFSSYQEYLSKSCDDEKISEYDQILNITPDLYKKFVEDNVSYQRELAKLKLLYC